MSKVMILLGSKADLPHADKMTVVLTHFGIPYQLRIASAHKVPLKAIDILKQNEDSDVVYITIAGRSNALSGFCDAQTVHPVIACPPPSDVYASIDIWSSLRMPSGVCPLTILEPEGAALAAVKIIACSDTSLRQKVALYQKKKRDELDMHDQDVSRAGA